MYRKELNLDSVQLRYVGIVGTGGIGSGRFFELNGNDTLGREESRSGHFKDVKDYCKQHIILHYIKVLLGKTFKVLAVGKVGDDDTGNVLFREMSEVGLDIQYVEKMSGISTLFSFCFHYPDGSGGNLSTDNSASALVDEDSINRALPVIEKLATKGIVMAAPEVPLDARYRLLVLGKQHGLFCAGSFTSEEIMYAYQSGIFKSMDLLSINMDEAAALSGFPLAETQPAFIVAAVVKKLQQQNEKLKVSITGGKEGSWCWDGNVMTHFPAVSTSVKSTAGAGDAFFSGLLCGIAADLSLFEAQQLATLVAGLSVASPHTIHEGIDRQSLHNLLQSATLTFSPKIFSLLNK